MHAAKHNETMKGNYSKTNVNIEFSVSNLNRWQTTNHLTRSNASHMVNNKTKKHTFHCNQETQNLKRVGWLKIMVAIEVACQEQSVYFLIIFSSLSNFYFNNEVPLNLNHLYKQSSLYIQTESSKSSLIYQYVSYTINYSSYNTQIWFD